MKKLNRRNILTSAAAAGGGLFLGNGLRGLPQARAQTGDDKFLIVLTATGGASIIDSVLAIRQSESANAQSINTFPDAMVSDVADSPFRSVAYSSSRLGQLPIPISGNQMAFLNKHKQDLMAVTCTGTSVNHAIAQKRSLTGNEAWGGRTLPEAVANAFGANKAIPNIQLATGTSYIERGVDDSLPGYAYGETVAAPSLFPLALDGAKGVSTIDRDLLLKARALRNDKLDPYSRFRRVFARSGKLDRWENMRNIRQPAIESQDLIKKLMLLPESGAVPLSDFGLSESDAGEQVRARFPNYRLDPLQAQAAMAFLLIKYGVSNAVTIGSNFDAIIETQSPEVLINPPLAFDYSHQDHRGSQALMWRKVMTIADSLIDLLKAEEYAAGQSYWDRSLIFIATDFGRTKGRPSGASTFGTSHDINNGFLILSPLANGNRILGGVNPDTGMTYGFDPTTGAPDVNRTTQEAEVYAGILHALGVDTSGSGLPDVRAMRKNA